MRVLKMRHIVLLLALIVGLTFVFSTIVNAWSSGADTPVQVDRVYIQTGDTLWGIAKRYLPEDNSTDIRDYISKIKKYNGMRSSTLIAGDTLEIPLLESR